MGILMRWEAWECWCPYHNTGALSRERRIYGDVLRYVYVQLYKMNVECDFLWPEAEQLEKYGYGQNPTLCKGQLLYNGDQGQDEGKVLA